MSPADENVPPSQADLTARSDTSHRQAAGGQLISSGGKGAATHDGVQRGQMSVQPSKSVRASANVKKEEVEEEVDPETQSLIEVIQQEIEQDKKFNPKERNLPEDTFSFLIFSQNPWSIVLSIFVGLLQLGFFTCIAFDVFDDAVQNENYKTERGVEIFSTHNKLAIPEKVDPQVKAAGFLAIFIAVYMQQDAAISLTLLVEGYNDNLFKHAFNDGVNVHRWFWSAVIRLVVGLMSLFVSLLLIVQSEEVLDLLLNFSAIEIVSCLDDVAFYLAQKGYFGEDCRKDAGVVTTKSYELNGNEDDSADRNCGQLPWCPWCRHVSLVLIWGFMGSLWFLAAFNRDKVPPGPIPLLEGCPTQPSVPFRLELDSGNTKGKLSLKWRLASHPKDSEDVILIEESPTYHAGDRNVVVEQFCVSSLPCYSLTLAGDFQNLENYTIYFDGQNVTTRTRPHYDALEEVVYFGDNDCEFEVASVFCRKACYETDAIAQFEYSENVTIDGKEYSCDQAVQDSGPLSFGNASREECIATAFECCKPNDAFLMGNTGDEQAKLVLGEYLLVGIAVVLVASICCFGNCVCCCFGRGS